MSSKGTPPPGGDRSGSRQGTPKGSKPPTPTLGKTQPVDPSKMSAEERLKAYNIAKNREEEEANKRAIDEREAERKGKSKVSPLADDGEGGAADTTPGSPETGKKGGSKPSTPKPEPAKPASGGAKQGTPK